MAHVGPSQRIFSGRGVVVNDDHFAFDRGSRLFALSGLPSRVVIDSLAAAAGARRAVVVMRHLVGVWAGECWSEEVDGFGYA